MLYDETAVKANIRNREGRRVFFLGEKDRLTPSARDWLRREGIEIANPAEIPRSYRLPNGATLTEKPEHYTHLRGDILVPKTHPVIAFRGAMDTLQAQILLAQPVAPEAIRKDLGEILDLARKIIAWDVLEEPAKAEKLCGLTQEEQRRHSHFPQDHYGQTHFMPEYTDGEAMLRLNAARCAAREAELAAVRAFVDLSGVCAREDLLQILNRMSSMLYILMIRLKAKK